jgi:hypothetical protein
MKSRQLKRRETYIYLIHVASTYVYRVNNGSMQYSEQKDVWRDEPYMIRNSQHLTSQDRIDSFIMDGWRVVSRIEAESYLGARIHEQSVPHKFFTKTNRLENSSANVDVSPIDPEPQTSREYEYQAPVFSQKMLSEYEVGRSFEMVANCTSISFFSNDCKNNNSQFIYSQAGYSTVAPFDKAN